jgi:hypothetical protein
VRRHGKRGTELEQLPRAMTERMSMNTRRGRPDLVSSLQKSPEIAPSRSFRAVIATGLLSVACGQASLPMEPGAPLEMKRAYCFANPTFLQARRERNRDDTLEQLSRYKDVEPYVSTGTSLTIGSRVGGVIGTSALILGLLGADGSMKMSQTTSTALIASGASAAVLSTVLCIVGEGKYATAVEVYNDRLSKKGGAADQDDADASESGDDDSKSDKASHEP